MAKQDVTVWLFYNSEWNNVTERARTRDPITINHGAGNEQTGVVPSDASLTFDNRDGEMNPENRKSSLFGLIGHNTPIQIDVGEDVRFSGQVVSWKPRRAIKGDAWVEISAQGTIRRLGQGEPRVESAIYRLALSAAEDPFREAYWPCEDDTDSTQLGEGSGGIAATFEGEITLAQFDRFPGSLPIPVLGADGQIRGTVPTYPDGAFAFRGIFFMPSGGVATGLPIVDIFATGSGKRWQVIYGDGGFSGNLHLRALSEAGAVVDQTSVFDYSDVLHGQRFLLSVDATQNGSDTDVVLFVLSINADNRTTENAITAETFTGFTVGHATEIAVGSDGGLTDCAVGHLGIGNSQDFIFGISSAIYGYNGERAGVRFNFLCLEEGIAPTVIGDPDETQEMGPQYPDTVLNLFAECARTDAGIIHDSRHESGLTFRTGRSLYNQ